MLDLLAAPELAHLHQQVVFLRGGERGPFKAADVLAQRPRPGSNELCAAAAVIRARPTILHGWLLRGNAFAAAAGVALPGTCVLTSERNLGHNLTPAKRVLERLVTRREHRCIANSSAVAEAAVARAPHRAGRIEVIPPGVAMPRGPVEPQPSSVVMVGRLFPVKDHATALRAWAELVGRRPGVTMTVVGDGPARPEIENMVASLGLGDSVALVGERDPWPYLVGADIYLSSSRSEGFSRSMIEALVAGRPIVSTAVGGACELPPATVRLVAVGDHGEMAGALDELLGDASVRRRVEQAALAARAQYASEVCHGRYRDLYASLGAG